ncbi:hypothetical protein GIB67_019740 [Kingdonia uniflora]|uniref:DUF6857 domain-containing protein n=1 Tax=Kingdonia uniflora TaxID=39325 RepID=A0A7J7MK93_9MAGN|nr:hypothetical protein GIB67_019740 [Kingdonia uniflora]
MYVELNNSAALLAAYQHCTGEVIFSLAVCLNSNLNSLDLRVKLEEGMCPPQGFSTGVGLDKKASSTRESSLNQISLIKSPSKSKSKSPPLKVTTNPSNSGIKPPKENALPSHLVKVSLHGKTCFDQSFSLTSIPASIHDLGKDVVRRKNAACLASVNALHEASAAENIIRCLSVFAELCDSTRQDSPGLTVKKFLDLSHSMQQAASVVDALFKVRSSKAIAIASQLPSSDVHKLFNDKHANASSWVHAALETDLSTFSHFSKQEKKGKPHNGENYHCVVLETRDPAEVEPKNHSPQNKKNLKGTPSPKRWLGISAIKKVKEERGDWSKGKGLNEVSSLAKRLLFVSRKWFLKYLEDSLNDGFGSNLGKGNEISSLLGQLKRVNHWLEKANGDGSKVDERVDNLKKKLYNFLLEHVDSTVY